jgi:hypothetical protein
MKRAEQDKAGDRSECLVPGTGNRHDRFLPFGVLADALGRHFPEQSLTFRAVYAFES